MPLVLIMEHLRSIRAALDDADASGSWERGREGESDASVGVGPAGFDEVFVREAHRALDRGP